MSIGFGYKLTKITKNKEKQLIRPLSLLTKPPSSVTIKRLKGRYRGVEQMVARRAHNPEVVRFKSHPRNQYEC